MTGRPNGDDRPGASGAAIPEETLQDLYENAPCGYLSALPDGTIIRVNSTFLSWTGYRREEVEGRMRFQDLLTPGGRIYYETHYAPQLRMQGAVREIALDLVCAGDRQLPVLVNTILKMDPHGAPLLSRSTVFDATERRAYERELLDARRRAEESESRARELARTLQASFIPPTPPEIPGFTVEARYRPAGAGDEVGGDFYDVFEAGDQRWAIVLGDVEGKGAGAASVTALARFTIRAAAVAATGPSHVLRALNRALIEQEAERFCTVVFGLLSPVRDGRGVLHVASAGHQPPLVWTSGASPRRAGRPGDILGVWPDPEMWDEEVTLKPGDITLFYTDGVVEGRGPDGFFGEARLLDLFVATAPQGAAAVVSRLVDEVVRFQGGMPRDDIAVLAIQVR